MSSFERPSIEKIARTLEVRDPNNLTICVGGAAIAAALAEAGVDPGDQKDVDVLCPQNYFDNLIKSAQDLQGVEKFKLRWPKGRLKERGATNQSVDIYPDVAAQEEGIMPYTACVSMSDLWYPIDYETCMAQPDRLTVVSGIRCLRLPEILRWIAIVGRETDIEKVDEVLPKARAAGLVSDEEQALIIAERAKSISMRNGTSRHYARVDERAAP